MVEGGTSRGRREEQEVTCRLRSLSRKFFQSTRLKPEREGGKKRRESEGRSRREGERERNRRIKREGRGKCVSEKVSE